jgi:hypothetical protein
MCKKLYGFCFWKKLNVVFSIGTNFEIHLNHPLSCYRETRCFSLTSLMKPTQLKILTFTSQDFYNKILMNFSISVSKFKISFRLDWMIELNWLISTGIQSKIYIHIFESNFFISISFLPADCIMLFPLVGFLFFWFKIENSQFYGKL